MLLEIVKNKAARSVSLIVYTLIPDLPLAN